MNRSIGICHTRWHGSMFETTGACDNPVRSDLLQMSR